MRKGILLISALIVSQLLSAEILSVSQAIKKTDGSATYHSVQGYVVGELSAYSNNKYFYQIAPPFKGSSAYLLADSPNEIELAKMLPVAIDQHGIDSLNLEENPIRWRKQVVVNGYLRDYFAMPGLKSVNGYQFSAQSWEDQTAYWSFYDSMEGEYKPKTANMFGGGTYIGERYTWKIVGGTYGNTSNDSKWEDASIRLRLTEATSGERGYMELLSDKAAGIGTVRFWAGYYDKDNAGAISVAISSDQGKTWRTKVNSQAIAKDWKEYQFEINEPGSLRIRILKGDNGDAGINIDNLHISDYKIPSSTIDITTNKVVVYVQDGAIHLLSDSLNHPIEIVNMQGATLYRGVMESESWQMAFSRGIYLVKVGTHLQKVVL